jgi:hypothetical protein
VEIQQKFSTFAREKMQNFIPAKLQKIDKSDPNNQTNHGFF